MLKEDRFQIQAHNNQEVSFFLSSKSFVVNPCFFFFIVEETSGEGSASFFLFSRKHSKALFYIVTTSQGEENFKNLENLGAWSLGFCVCVWSGDLGHSTLGCDLWDQETPRLGALEFFSLLKEGVGALGHAICLKKRRSLEARCPRVFFNIATSEWGAQPHLPPWEAKKTYGLES